MAVSTVPAASSSRAFGAHSTWREVDWILLFLVFALASWSCLTLMSATHSPNDTGGLSSWFSPIVLRQLVFVCAGFALIALLAAIDFQWWMHLQFWIYSACIAALVAVLALGKEVNGAKSWIGTEAIRIQPSEFTKFGVILVLAAFLCRRQDRIREAGTVVWSLVYLAPLLLLILKQPDFGTMMAVLCIWLGMLFFGGARWQHLLAVILVGSVVFGAAWQGGILKPHQKDRLSVFLNPDPTSDVAKREGYHITQSLIAIGGGQITGQGWAKGMQNRAGYVPEKTTDFIFAVVAEELGFAGSALLVFLYLCLLLRSAQVAMTTDNYFGVLIAGGWTALIGFHAIVNLGMTMRVMPITGVPLPFFSYGGSSFLAFAMCIGLLQSISLRRHRLSF
jgi:rod shape determining protein RodA